MSAVQIHQPSCVCPTSCTLTLWWPKRPVMSWTKEVSTYLELVSMADICWNCLKLACPIKKFELYFILATRVVEKTRLHFGFMIYNVFVACLLFFIFINHFQHWLQWTLHNFLWHPNNTALIVFATIWLVIYNVVQWDIWPKSLQYCNFEVLRNNALVFKCSNLSYVWPKISILNRCLVQIC